jgi:hypothetical protein
MSRVCGYFAAVQHYNPGKRREFTERVVYKPDLRDPDGTTSAEREMIIHGGGLE